MDKNMIRRDLIQLDWTVADQDEFFTRMIRELEELGYVKGTFDAAIRQREATFPTALPTQPEAIAIPHSDVEHIERPFIACTRLAQPIGWHEMGNDENQLQVRFIFMLGFTGTDGHVQVLQMMLDNFMDAEFIHGLESMTTEDEFYDLIRSMRGMDS